MSRGNRGTLGLRSADGERRGRSETGSVLQQPQSTAGQEARSKFKERRFEPGTTVVQEGQMSGIGFFIITEGEATVTVAGNEVGKLGPGDHFGELALIAERERTATVTARTQLDCVELAVWDFREFVQTDSDVSWKLLHYVVNVLLDERSSAGHRT